MPLKSNEDESKRSSKTEKMDFKYNYSCSLLKDGLLDWARMEASSVGDGETLFQPLEV